MEYNCSNFDLKRDGKRLYLDGTLSELKQFVTEDLKLSGTWKSPGGDVKLFTTEFLSVKWQGKRKKWITISGQPVKKNDLIELLTSRCKNAADSLDKSCEFSCQEESDHITKAPIAEETDESNNSGEISNYHSDEINETRSKNLIEDLTRLIDKLSKETLITTSADRPTSIDISEIKLELAMLWATVNSLQEKSIQSQTPATENHIPPTKSTSTQTTIEETGLKIKYRCETSPRNNFQQQLNNYRLTQIDRYKSQMKSQKDKHEIKVNPDHDNTRKVAEPKNRDFGHDKTRKTIKPKHSLRAENKRISGLERTFKTIKQDNESLKAIM